jgi:hypothetical protein
MTDLKTQNEPKLKAFMLVSVLIAYGSIAYENANEITEFLDSPSLKALAGFGTLIGLGCPMLVGLATYLLTNSMESENKFRIAHFRWNDPLPGGRAHQLIPVDPRMEVGNCSPEVSELLNEELTQKTRQAKWFNLYQKVKTDPSVNSVHKSYLLMRDAATSIFMFTVFTLLIDFVVWVVMDVKLSSPMGYLGLMLFLLFVAFRANGRGKRLVTTAAATFNAQHL